MKAIIKKICKNIVIAEDFSYPFDEGAKKCLLALYNNLLNLREYLFVTDLKNDVNGLKVEKIVLGKLFSQYQLKSLLDKHSPNFIIYLPKASYTFNSLLRAKILKVLSKQSKIVVVGFQRRKFNMIFKFFLRFMKPDLLFVFDDYTNRFFSARGFNIKKLPPVVDLNRFIPVNKDIKFALRSKYGFNFSKKIILHVGHIKTTRNIASFISIQNTGKFQVVLVGSTSTRQDNKLKGKMRDAGIIVIDSYIENIEEIYQLADIYVFPVRREDSAIDMPLSVLEAISCNLPIVTTRFGALPDYFSEDNSFKYFDFDNQLLDKINNIDLVNINNCEKVKDYSWDNFANTIIDEYKKL